MISKIAYENGILVMEHKYSGTWKFLVDEETANKVMASKCLGRAFWDLRQTHTKEMVQNEQRTN